MDNINKSNFNNNEFLQKRSLEAGDINSREPDNSQKRRDLREHFKKRLVNENILSTTHKNDAEIESYALIDQSLRKTVGQLPESNLTYSIDKLSLKQLRNFHVELVQGLLKKSQWGYNLPLNTYSKFFLDSNLRLDEGWNLHQTFLGNGAFNTVNKITYYSKAPSRKPQMTFVSKEELAFTREISSSTYILGIHKDKPKTVFRNLLYSEMDQLLGFNIAPCTSLSIINGKLYTIMEMATGNLAAGTPKKVKIKEKTELEHSLNHAYRAFEAQKQGINGFQDFESYLKGEIVRKSFEEDPRDDVKSCIKFPLLSVRNPEIKGTQMNWYGMAMMPHQVSINFNDSSLHEALVKMQLLDLLVFQLDRNLCNFFIKTNAQGSFERLITIDNDLCVSKRYLEKHLLKREDYRSSEMMMFPAWVSPEIAKKISNLTEVEIDIIFDKFKGIFGDEEKIASKQMLQKLQQHMRLIDKNDKSLFMQDERESGYDSQLFYIKSNLKTIQDALNNPNKRMWEPLNNSDKLHKASQDDSIEKGYKYLKKITGSSNYQLKEVAYCL